MPTGDNKVWRTAMLSRLLSENNNIIRWTSTFDHQKKIYLYNKNIKVKVSDNLSRFFLHSNTPYSNNVSFSRIINQRKNLCQHHKKKSWCDISSKMVLILGKPIPITSGVRYEVMKSPNMKNEIKSITVSHEITTRIK